MCLVAAILAYGSSSLLQATGARQAPPGMSVGRAALGFLRSWQYVLGTVLDLVAVALIAVALRTLPLFVVQAGAASSLVITAIGSAYLFPRETRRGTLPSIVAVVAGLVLLGSAAAPGPSETVGPGAALLLGLGLPVLLGAGMVLSRARVAPHVREAALAGLAYAGMGVSLRVLHVPGNAWLTVLEPAALAAAGYLLVALFFFGRALRSGTVTEAMAIVVSLDTILPAGIGVLLLGDATRPGWSLALFLGLAITVAGLTALIRTLPALPVDPADDPVPAMAAPSLGRVADRRVRART